MAASDLLTYESEHDNETVPSVAPSAKLESYAGDVGSPDLVDRSVPTSELERERAPAPSTVLPEELDFYESYAWCLNPHLTVREAIGHLREEIHRLAVVPRGWQTGEVATNVVLLSSGLLNCVDEYLRGPRLSNRAQSWPRSWSSRCPATCSPSASVSRRRFAASI